jgi:endonuclease/exonuclease/phosphatase (EEP) superfamily protein YafD
VLTFNAGGNEGGGQPEPLIRLLRAERADVVALQEMRRSTLEVLATTLRAEYPYQVGTPDTATLSRLPILDANELSFHDSAYLSQQLELEIEERVLTLTNVHVKRPTAGLNLRRVLSWGRTYDADWRDAQVEALVPYIRGVTGPQLVTGDFNQTPWSTSYPLVTAVLQDSFREAGWGFGHTFPSSLAWAGWNLPLPLLRIDYVFHSGELVAQQARVGSEAGSHHLPVIVNLAFR